MSKRCKDPNFSGLKQKGMTAPQGAFEGIIKSHYKL